MIRHFHTPPPSQHQRDISSSSPAPTHTRKPSSTSLRQLERRLSRRLSSSSDLLKRLSPTKEKMSPPLRRALDLLNLPSLGALELHFLKTDAFLKPWSNFRDGFLLLQPNGMPRASLPGQISRVDILRWYTHFDEGQRRYDAWAEAWEKSYEEYHGGLDTSLWRVGEHEKLMYVWLLQSFKVGKGVNPFGFEYFEYLSVCTAWQEVFVPIVDAVRKDYNMQGRYHYGRLAKFVEEHCPSRLAFPETNIGVGKGVSVPAYHVLSPPRKREDIDPVTGMLKSRMEARKTMYEEDERELRMVYPQFGEAVRRPTVKTRIENWIREQADVIQQKTALRHLEGGNAGLPRSHSHGKTFRFATGAEYSLEKQARDGRKAERKDRNSLLKREDSDYSTKTSTESFPHLGHQRQSSDGVYSSIRSLNPFSEDASQLFGESPGHQRQGSGGINRAATVAVEAKASPLEEPFFRHQRKVSVETHGSPLKNQFGGHEQKVPNDSYRAPVRKPSYEGNGYGPSLPSLKEAHSSEKVRPTRIPSPIHIPPNETTRKYHPIVERAIERAETTPIPSEPAPIVPSKNPQRWTSRRGHVRVTPSAQHEPGGSVGSVGSAGDLGPRIVSIENIRTAVGGLSRESSAGSLRAENSSRQISIGERQAFAAIGGRGLNLGESPTLPTYNTHMFPREPRSTPVKAMQSKGSKYKMNVLKNGNGIEK